MAPPKSAPAPTAAPRRGKFLSAPSPSPTGSVPNTPSSTGSRGKFMNKASPSQGAASATLTAAGDADNIRSQIHNSKAAASSRRKALAGQREQVFRDLDEAETIVLSLLECGECTVGHDHAKSKEKEKNGEAGGDEEATPSFEQLTATVRSNGVGYLAGVKKLHKLLAPHAPLVKSYKSHDRGESGEGDNPPHKSLATLLPGAANGTSSKIVEEATSNIYQARVKKRLAVERSEILKVMLEEAEEEDSGGQGKQQKESADSTGPKRSKRKRK
ncbi:hypothetical protein ACHAXT_002269 [Thalassiosira profunda]